jgi:hypothetical protein
MARMVDYVARARSAHCPRYVKKLRSKRAMIQKHAVKFATYSHLSKTMALFWPSWLAMN